jgi:hypothetical protein
MFVPVFSAVSALCAALGVCCLTLVCWPAADPWRTRRRWHLASGCALAATSLLTSRIILGFLLTAARVAGDTLANFGNCATWGSADPDGRYGPDTPLCLAYHARTDGAFHYLLPLAGVDVALFALGVALYLIARRSAKLEVSPCAVLAGSLRRRGTWAWLLVLAVVAEVLLFLS